MTARQHETNMIFMRPVSVVICFFCIFFSTTGARVKELKRWTESGI